MRIKEEVMTKTKAVKHFGSQAKLAEALGIKQAAIAQWNEEAIPKLREFEIKEILEKRKTKRKKG